MVPVHQYPNSCEESAHIRIHELTQSQNFQVEYPHGRGVKWVAPFAIGGQYKQDMATAKIR